LELLQYTPGDGVQTMPVHSTSYQRPDNGFDPIPPPQVPGGGGVLVTDAPLPLQPAQAFQHRQILFLRLRDRDQNRDSSVQESVEVRLTVPDHDEQETLRLLETAPDSGVFTGYLTMSRSAARRYDGVLNIVAGKAIQASYTDRTSLTETAGAAALVDPFGRLFDSNSGARHRTARHRVRRRRGEQLPRHCGHRGERHRRRREPVRFWSW